MITAYLLFRPGSCDGADIYEYEYYYEFFYADEGARNPTSNLCPGFELLDYDVKGSSNVSIKLEYKVSHKKCFLDSSKALKKTFSIYMVFSLMIFFGFLMIFFAFLMIFFK